MQTTVHITFPCSPEEWSNLLSIKEIMGEAPKKGKPKDLSSKSKEPAPALVGPVKEESENETIKTPDLTVRFIRRFNGQYSINEAVGHLRNYLKSYSDEDIEARIKENIKNGFIRETSEGKLAQGDIVELRLRNKALSNPAEIIEETQLPIPFPAATDTQSTSTEGNAVSVLVTPPPTTTPVTEGPAPLVSKDLMVRMLVDLLNKNPGAWTLDGVVTKLVNVYGQIKIDPDALGDLENKNIFLNHTTYYKWLAIFDYAKAQVPPLVIEVENGHRIKHIYPNVSVEKPYPTKADEKEKDAAAKALVTRKWMDERVLEFVEKNPGMVVTLIVQHLHELYDSVTRGIVPQYDSYISSGSENICSWASALMHMIGNHKPLKTMHSNAVNKIYLASYEPPKKTETPAAEVNPEAESHKIDTKLLITRSWMNAKILEHVQYNPKSFTFAQLVERLASWYKNELILPDYFNPRDISPSTSNKLCSWTEAVRSLLDEKVILRTTQDTSGCVFLAPVGFGQDTSKKVEASSAPSSASPSTSSESKKDPEWMKGRVVSFLQECPGKFHISEVAHELAVFYRAATSPIPEKGPGSWEEFIRSGTFYLGANDLIMFPISNSNAFCVRHPTNGKLYPSFSPSELTDLNFKQHQLIKFIEQNPGRYTALAAAKEMHAMRPEYPALKGDSWLNVVIHELFIDRLTTKDGFTLFRQTKDSEVKSSKTDNWART